MLRLFLTLLARGRVRFLGGGRLSRRLLVHNRMLRLLFIFLVRGRLRNRGLGLLGRRLLHLRFLGVIFGRVGWLGFRIAVMTPERRFRQLAVVLAVAIFIAGRLARLGHAENTEQRQA